MCLTMPDYELGEAILTSPEVGQEADKAEPNKTTEVPDKSGEATEDPKLQDKAVKKQPDNLEKQGPDDKETKGDKKYAEQFTSRSGMIKSAENLAEARGETVDFDNMTTKEIEDWYIDSRKRFSTEGFKGDRSKTKEINKAAKADEAKLNEFVEEKQQEAQLEAEEEAPLRPEFDWDKYNEILFDDPRTAAKMIGDFEKAKDKYLDDRIEFEAKRLGKGLQPMADNINRLTQKEQVEAEVSHWNQATANVHSFITEHFGAEEAQLFVELKAEMVKGSEIDWPVYEAMVKADPKKGREQAIFKLFQNTKDKIRLQQLEADMAEMKNGKTLDQIQATKGISRVAQTTGGTNQRTASGLSPEQAKEKSIEAVRGPKTRYDIDNY